jgi:hypothetical protein
MIRKQIYIEPDQDEAIKREAYRRGLTEAEVIRRCIDRHMTDLDSEENDGTADELLLLLREREARLPTGGGTPNFYREDLYIR